jgi:hypothetical protein
MSSGSRAGAMSTDVPTRTRSVAPATTARVVSGSKTLPAASGVNTVPG